MSIAFTARKWLPVLAVALFVGCADSSTPTDPPTAPRQLAADRSWAYLVDPEPGKDPTFPDLGLSALDGEHGQEIGVVSDSREFGALALAPPGLQAVGKAEVFSNETGETYWVQAQAPRAGVTNDSLQHLGVALSEELWYVVDAPNPALTFTVTGVQLDGIDDDPPLAGDECVPVGAGANDCEPPIRAAVVFALDAEVLGDSGRVRALPLDAMSVVRLEGYVDHWRYGVETAEDFDRAAFDSTDFDLTTEPGVAGRQTRGRVRLKAHLPFAVPLGSVHVGDTVAVFPTAVAYAEDDRQQETFSGAYFRDPASPVGVRVDAQGVHRVPGRHLPKPAVLPVPPCAGGGGGAAGTFQFAAPAFVAGERGRLNGRVTVTRTGGTAGLVSATVATSDGTATGGPDYGPRSAVLRWADGEGGARTVEVPIRGDTLDEPDETVNLTLSDAGGCATLGGQRTAVLTIRDDDGHVALPRTFSIGGEVRGLIGSGLVLREQKSGLEVRPTASGPFTVATGRPDGAEYAVTVATQPSNPLQTCIVVADSTGRIAGANVTSIGVDCTAPPASGALDPSFGDGGRVVSPTLPSATAMAVQPDGKTVVASDNKVMRFNADGASDRGFGKDGQADFTFPDVPNATNHAQGVAVQPDGRIVVVGFAQSSSDARDRFVVAQYGADGALDTGFGTGGRVIVDFGARSAGANAVTLLGDGRMVVAGGAQLGATNFDSSDVVVAQLTATGALDPTFGVGGRVHTHFSGATAEAFGVGRQRDGRIVVAGAVSSRRGDRVDLALASYTPSGAPDTTFGRQGGTPGHLRVNFGTEVHANALVVQPDGQIAIAGDIGGGSAIQFLLVRVSSEGGVGAPIATSLTTQGDRAEAIALLPNGDVVVAGRAGLFGVSDFGIARFSRTGGLDAAFGSGGKLLVDFTGGVDGAEAVAVQPDGKVVVAGFAHSGTSGGLGMARVSP